MGLLSNRRRMLGGLPYDYEVEYIEMNDKENPSYLDLGIVLEENVYDVYGEFTLLGYINNVAFAGWFGCFNKSPYYSIAVNKHFVSNYGIICNIASSTLDRSVRFDDISYNTKYNILLKRNREVYINGEYIGETNAAHLTGGINTFKVFRNEDYTYGDQYPAAYTLGRIHSIKIWKEDALIHDYIPVVINGIGYMYDKVSHKLFGAQGGGKLVCGTAKDIKIVSVNGVYTGQYFGSLPVVFTVVCNRHINVSDVLQVEFMETGGRRIINKATQIADNIISANTNGAVDSLIISQVKIKFRNDKSSLINFSTK